MARKWAPDPISRPAEFPVPLLPPSTGPGAYAATAVRRRNGATARWRTEAAAGTVEPVPHAKEVAQMMTGFRRVFAWLIVATIVLMLVATLVLEDAS